ncbi:MAG TPA: hypothetical protein VFP28_05650 [Gemmatimonadales bacterium]|nr:hypothetical protein [Gemmatimonadales bacterium]
MSRLSVAVVALVCSVAVVACADNILKERPTAKAVRTSTPRASFSAQGSAKGQSSVCAAYRRQLRVVQLRRAALSDPDGQLKARELSLNAIIADACE